MVEFAIAKALEVLEKWANDNGLIEVSRGDDYLVCKEGNNIIMYKGLYLDIPTENDVTRELALMAKDRMLYNKYYIVTTPDIANFIDGGLVKKLGIGVMVIDGSAVKEVMRSVPIEITSIKGQVDDQRIRLIEREIRELEGRIKELENKVNQLMQVMNELRRAPQKTSSAEVTQPQVTQEVNVPTPDNVPSFVKDNPWLSILMSKSESNQ